MIRRPPRSTLDRSSAASDVYKRQDQQWAGLGYLRPPDFRLACEEHSRLIALLRASGAEVLELPADPRTGLDSLYAHDPVLMCDSGAIVFQMGKSARRGEGPA